ncbi:MAG: hypothetical protein AAF371_20445, partial [Pseudomonadota bacterium]
QPIDAHGDTFGKRIAANRAEFFHGFERLQDPWIAGSSPAMTELEHFGTSRVHLMLGPDPSIHGRWRWIAGSSPAMTAFP